MVVKRNPLKVKNPLKVVKNLLKEVKKKKKKPKLTVPNITSGDLMISISKFMTLKLDTTSKKLKLKFTELKTTVHIKVPVVKSMITLTNPI